MIAAVLLDISCTAADALNDGVSCEVSFASVNALTTNDTRASIIGGRAYQGFLTTGGSQVGKAIVIDFGPDGIPVNAGERMYLHVAATGTVSSQVTVFLYVRVTSGSAPMRRRL
jgi:hypothetical protein